MHSLGWVFEGLDGVGGPLPDPVLGRFGHRLWLRLRLGLARRVNHAGGVREGPGERAPSEQPVALRVRVPFPGTQSKNEIKYYLSIY